MASPPMPSVPSPPLGFEQYLFLYRFAVDGDPALLDMKDVAVDAPAEPEEG